MIKDGISVIIKMVCSKCVTGAQTCPGNTVTRQYSKYTMKGKVFKSSMPSKDLNFKKRPAAFGCALQFYKYRYFPDICREIPFEIRDEKHTKQRLNIMGGLHAYQNDTSIILDE
jgi:hypothetical protein